jgi:DNA-binding NtrC family response regulator
LSRFSDTGRRMEVCMNTVVMLVDDEAPFVATMTKRLTKRELTVLSASSGFEALDLLAEERGVDVVILDVRMPGMDGIQTLREIKKIRPLVEVILLTGYATVETAMEGMRLGAFDYLMKPCHIDELMAKVRVAAGRKREREGRRRPASTGEDAPGRGE